MKKATLILFKTGAIAYLIVGVGHLIGHFTLPNADPKAYEFLSRLADYKFDFFGRHDLLEMHNGYSLMMGFMLLFFGLLLFFISGNANKLSDKKILLTACLGSLATFTIALKHFWLIPQIVSFIGSIAFVLAYLQYTKKAKA